MVRHHAPHHEIINGLIAMHEWIAERNDLAAVRHTLKRDRINLRQL